MGLIKETAEDAAVTIDKARAIREWASMSFARVLLVMKNTGSGLSLSYDIKRPDPESRAN